MLNIELFRFIFKAHSIQFTKEFLKKELLGREIDLANISEVLDRYCIPNMSIFLTPSQLQEAPFPSIAYLKNDDGKGNFVIISSYLNNQISYFDPVKGGILEPANNFLKKWTGIVLLLSPDNKSIEPNYKENKSFSKKVNLERLLILCGLAFFVILGSVSVYSQFNISIFISWILSLIGTSFSLMLVLKEFGMKNDFIEQVCKINEKTDCEAVLNSKASRIFGWLSWSEIGLIYFVATNFLFLFLSTFQSNSFLLSTLLILNCLAIPYPIFSIYYQKIVVKQWCPLCLSVQSVLILSFIALWFSGTSADILSINLLEDANIRILIYCLIAAFFLPIIVWFSIKRILISNQIIPNVAQKLMSWRRDFDIFKDFLNRQETLMIEPMPCEIIIGNPDVPITITIISTLFCSHCSEANKEIDFLLRYFYDELKVVVRFVGTTDKDQEVAEQILSYWDAENVEVVLNDWYEMVDYTKWTNKYPKKNSNIDFANIYQKHIQWANHMRFEATPIVFINGKMLKPPFSIFDMKFHIKNMIEEMASK